MCKIILDSSNLNCVYELGSILSKHLSPILKTKRPIIFLCIGTDRSTGDALGPLVGEKLKFICDDNITIMGNLASPVHAINIIPILNFIKSNYINPYIVAVDASLGSANSIGNIIIEDKPIIPGAALNKNLPSVGHISIKVIVNISGRLEFMVLQSTRLYTVMDLAEKVAYGIYNSIFRLSPSLKSKQNSLHK